MGLLDDQLALDSFAFIDSEVFGESITYTPRVGSALWRSVGLTGAHGYDYRNLGSSYVLEFVATEWVMCSYNPPWEDEFDE